MSETKKSSEKTIVDLFVLSNVAYNKLNLRITHEISSGKNFILYASNFKSSYPDLSNLGDLPILSYSLDNKKQVQKKLITVLKNNDKLVISLPDNYNSLSQKFTPLTYKYGQDSYFTIQSLENENLILKCAVKFTEYFNEKMSEYSDDQLKEIYTYDSEFELDNLVQWYSKNNELKQLPLKTELKIDKIHSDLVGQYKSQLIDVSEVKSGKKYLNVICNSELSRLISFYGTNTLFKILEIKKGKIQNKTVFNVFLESLNDDIKIDI